MKRTAYFIVGPPCAGKTTIARALLGFDDGKERTLVLIPKPKWTIFNSGRVVAAGHYTGATFDGADMVPYNGAKKALDYWLLHLRQKAELTIFDGDRFSNAPTINFLRPYVDCIEVEYITTSPNVLEKRRKARDWNPNPSWLKGRATKAQRFFDLYGKPKVESKPNGLDWDETDMD